MDFHSDFHTHEYDLRGRGVAPTKVTVRLYAAVDVGHFTHFAFTVNFTHCVKTKPDSGFTVKSRTLTVPTVNKKTTLSHAHIDI